MGTPPQNRTGYVLRAIAARQWWLKRIRYACTTSRRLSRSRRLLELFIGWASWLPGSYLHLGGEVGQRQ